MTILDHGYHLKKVLALRKEPEINVLQAVPVQQVVCENIYRAVASGMARTPALPSWTAGTGSGTGTGTSCRAIKMAFRGRISPEGKEGTSPQINKDSRRKGGNLRNGSNAGTSYLNCRNRLGNVGWNYLSRNYIIIFCVVFRS